MDMAAEDNPFGMRDPPDEEDLEAEEGEVLEVPTDVRDLVGSLFELIITGFVPEPGPLDWNSFRTGGLPTAAGPQLDGATDVCYRQRTSPESGVPRWNRFMVGYQGRARLILLTMRRSPELIVVGRGLLTN
jgi:hypothetical protein